MRITTKNTLIAGAFVVVAALISGFIVFFSRGPTQNVEIKGTNNVTSVGQSGGITANTVTINTATNPTLVFQSATIQKESNGYLARLILQSSNNSPLGEVELVARIQNVPTAKILSFLPGQGVSMNQRGAVSGDGRHANLTFSRSDGSYPVKLRVSEACKVIISGSHNLEPFEVEIR